MGRSDTWMHQGKYLFASGQYDESIKLLNRVIQKDPEDVEAWIFKGRVLYYQRKYMDALRCYEKAINYDPKNESAYSGIIQCCDKMIELDEKNIEVLDIKIGALIILGKSENALEICDSKPERNLKNAPRVWNWKGDLLRKENKYEDAIKYYDVTLKQDPKNDEAWINKGKALYLLGRASESAICFDNALKVDPKNAKVWAMLGMALRATYKYVESEAAFEKARELGYHDNIMNR